MRFWSLILFSLTLSQSCGKPGVTTSEVKGTLNTSSQACFDFPRSRYDDLEASLQGVEIFKNFSPAERPQLLKHFYSVPPEYRDILVRRLKDGSFEGVNKEVMDAAGNCRFDDESCIRISLSSTMKDVIEFSLIHEIGHGVQRVAARKLGKTNDELDKILEELIKEAKTHNAGPGKNRALSVRDYSLSSPKEFWSDSFQNYYCSPKTHEFLKTYLPKNYAFLQSVLIEPMWIKEPTYLNPEAAAYMEGVITLVNEATNSCDLVLNQVSKQDESGLFEVEVALKDKSDAPVKLVLNYKVPLATQVAKIRRGMPTYFSVCPAE